MARCEVEHLAVYRAPSHEGSLNVKTLRNNRQEGDPEVSGVGGKREDRARGLDHFNESSAVSIVITHTIKLRDDTHSFQSGKELVVTIKWSSFSILKFSTPFVA